MILILSYILSYHASWAVFYFIDHFQLTTKKIHVVPFYSLEKWLSKRQWLASDLTYNLNQYFTLIKNCLISFNVALKSMLISIIRFSYQLKFNLVNVFDLAIFTISPAAFDIEIHLQLLCSTSVLSVLDNNVSFLN